MVVMNDLLTFIPDLIPEIEAETDPDSSMPSLGARTSAVESTGEVKLPAPLKVGRMKSLKEIETRIGNTAKHSSAAQTISTKKTGSTIACSSKPSSVSTKKTGSTIACSSKPSSAAIGQPISRNSRFGRKLKPSHHSASINKLLCKEDDPTASDQPMEKSTVLIIYDDRMLGHIQVLVPGVKKCPEVPARLEQIMRQFQDDGLCARCDVVSSEMADLEDLELVHGPNYVGFISKLPLLSEEDLATYVDSRSMYLSEGEGTKTASFIAVGCVTKACDSVAQNKHKRAFAVVRPPGHHAMKNRADGFCVFNNASVGAAYLIQKYSMKKVFVVDFDVHHGNGTQSIFYDKNSVLFISIHSSELDYPEGLDRNTSYVGEGDGEGFNVNVPLKGRYGDSDLIAVWNHIVLPIATQFEPEVVLISAGYDAAKGDPMAHCKVTPPGFATITAKTCSVGTGRVIMVLEGGYNKSVTGRCASHSVRALLGDSDVILDEQTLAAPLVSTMETITQVKSVHSNYWVLGGPELEEPEVGAGRESINGV